MKYYLGLDNGGTTTKASLFDVYGNEVSTSSMSTATITPKPNYVERDMEEMWEANCKVVQDVLKRANVCANDVVGLGICGHGKGLYLWGKDNKPARNGIISTDNRAYEYPARWAKDGTEKKVMEISCQHIMSCQPVSLLAWIKDNEPHVYKNIKYIFECKDYVRFRFTGKPNAEYTDYSGANLINLYSRNYDINLLRLFGIEDLFPALPQLCSATEVVGYITESAAAKCGLLAGTPVIGGMFDINACALGVGVTDEKNICMIAGTWSINEYLRRQPVLNGTVKMNSLFALPEYYLVEESSPTSAGNSEWFINNFLKTYRGNFKTINNWVEDISPNEFVPVFLPFIMASNVHPNARGAFVGISANHTEKHLLRSVYEGVTFCHRMHYERLLESKIDYPKAIRLAGGAAHSTTWTQMFADVLQIPIETVQANETGTLGCAIAVATALHDYDNLTEAAEKMCSVSPAIIPNLNLKEIYDKKYSLYKKTIICLDSLWNDMQNLILEQ